MRRIIAALALAASAVTLGGAASREIADAQAQSTRITYRIEGRVTEERNLESWFTPAQIQVLEKLNRADVESLRRLDAVVVPTVWLEEMEYSPFPSASPEAAQRPKLLVVDLAFQAFGAYESGHLVRWGPVSSGRRNAATPSGLFHLTWRSRGRHSTINPAWFMEWYFNFDNLQGLAFHSHPLPGRPDSHGCIRLLGRDAQWLYMWGEGSTPNRNGEAVTAGTPLVIVGQYAFDSPPPWRDLGYLTRGVRLPVPAPPPRDNRQTVTSE